MPVAIGELAAIKKRQRFKEGATFGGKRIRRESQIISIDEGVSRYSDSPTISIGEAWTPKEFVEQARACEHPFATIHLADEITRAVFASLTLGAKGALDHQRLFKAKWDHRAAALAPDEDVFCSHLHPDVARFCRKKRPLLITEMLDELEFPAAD